jgi:hypothetical protein
MALKEAMERVLEEYPGAKDTAFAGNKLQVFFDEIFPNYYEPFELRPTSQGPKLARSESHANSGEKGGQMAMTAKIVVTICVLILLGILGLAARGRKQK